MKLFSRSFRTKREKCFVFHLSTIIFRYHIGIIGSCQNHITSVGAQLVCLNLVERRPGITALGLISPWSWMTLWPSPKRTMIASWSELPSSQELQRFLRLGRAISGTIHNERMHLVARWNFICHVWQTEVWFCFRTVNRVVKLNGVDGCPDPWWQIHAKNDR